MTSLIDFADSDEEALTPAQTQSQTLPVSKILQTLAFVACVTSICAAPSIDDYNVVWDTPSENAFGSMLLGNGDIALNAWVEPSGDLVFYIAKSDAWSGDLTSPGYGAYGLIKVGRLRVSLAPNVFAGAPGFRQELRLREGVFEVSAGPDGRTSRLKLWVDANRPVIMVEASCAEPVRMKVSLESWRTVPTPWLGTDTVVPGQKNRVVWFYKCPNKEVPELVNLTTGAAILGDGLVNEGDFALKSAEPNPVQRASIYPFTAQCPTAREWIAGLDARIAATDARSRGDAWQAHKEWWMRFWDRSHIFITSGEKSRDVTVGYLLQRFKNACTGRGKYPIKFNGSLFTVDYPEPKVIKDKTKDATRKKPDTVMPVTADFRWWGHQYWFQNTRPIYWPMMASGDFDLMQPFFKMYRDMLPRNKMQVREFYGHDGAYFRETAPFWGGLEKITPETKGGYTTHYYTPILEYSAMALDYLAYTGDKEFAKNTLIPMADAGVTFYSEHFKRDANGKLFISPANSIEMFWKVNNPLPDIAGLSYVLRGLLALPTDLSTPTERQRWQKMLGELPPIPVGECNGKRQLIPHENPPAPRHNSENPELYAIYPFRIYGQGKPDFELAKNAFDARRFRRAQCWSQEAVQAALMGDTATAKKYVISHLTRRDKRMRFPAVWENGSDYIPDEDNGGNGLHALQTMLVQFDGRRILLLPAWPKDWDVDFKLRAPYETTVAASVRAGKITELTVTPPERKKDVLITEPK